MKYHLSPITYQLLTAIGTGLLLTFFLISDTHALTISPLRHTVVIDPGKSETVTLTITNDSGASVSLLPEVDAFGLDTQTGRAVFGARDEAMRWVEPLDKKLALAPGAADDLAFRVTVPKDAEPGSHYLGLFVGQSPAEGMVGVGARVGALLFLHVAGEVREELMREDFFPSRKLYTKTPIELSLWLRNNGTIHVVPDGELILQKGKRVIDRQSVNGLRRKILPGERWEETYQFKKLGWRDAGRVEAVVSLQYGITHQPIVDRVTFWYAPTGLAAGAGAGGLVLALAFWRLIRRRRKMSSYRAVE